MIGIYKRLFKRKKGRFNLFNGAFLMGTLATSMFSLFSLSFSWFTSSDAVSNKFIGTYLVAEIDEVFTPEKKWKPGEIVQKEVKIKNSGETPALVRVSFYEFLLSFKVDVTDQTGNGNLMTASQAIEPIVKEDDLNTWSEAADKGGTFQLFDNYYVANQAFLTYPETREGMYEYNNIAKREDTPFEHIELIFSDNIKTEVDPSSTVDYWLYEKGYFYYSRPLQPKESTINLLTNLGLSNVTPNKFKGSLYKLKVYMDAHDQSNPIIGTWGINTDDQAYQLLTEYIKN